MQSQPTARELPRFHPRNEALKSRADVARAIAEVQRLQLPPHPDPPKNWDALAALHDVLAHTRPDSAVLDAGAERYSSLLPWLAAYGYRNLTGNNLVFDRDRPVRVGPILYEHGDLTSTTYAAGTFDAITCLSVIEHGVDLGRYFAEMTRLLKPGGVLVTSTDYYETPTDTRGQHAYGGPIRVFTRDDLRAALRSAERFGLRLDGPIDFSCEDRAVTWREFDLSYTFIVFTLTKVG